VAPFFLRRFFGKQTPRALFLAQTRGDTFRYRCKHAAEALRFAGWEAGAVLLPGALPRPVADYDVIVLHRFILTPELERILDQTRSQGRRLVFDTDDLIFSPEFLQYFRPLETAEERERERHHWRVKELRRTLSYCDAALVPTRRLREAVLESRPGLPVWIVRNAVSEIMAADAEKALQGAEARGDGLVRLGYFSGSPTHSRDFAECLPALLASMEKDKRLRLLLVGDIEPPEELDAVREQVEITPRVSWRELPALIRRADINLAPLETDSPFTACKSELKYFEAGLVGVPTVASAVGGFKEAIRPGENGFLCKGNDDWREAIGRLAGDVRLRRSVGEAAREDVLARYTTRSRAEQFRETMEKILALR